MSPADFTSKSAKSMPLQRPMITMPKRAIHFDLSPATYSDPEHDVIPSLPKHLLMINVLGNHSFSNSLVCQWSEEENVNCLFNW